MRAKTNPTGPPRHDTDYPPDDVRHWLTDVRVLARSTGKRFVSGQAESADMEQAGVLELVRCWHLYDAGKGPRAKWVAAVAWRGIVDALRRGDCSRRVIRVPRHVPLADRAVTRSLDFYRCDEADGRDEGYATDAKAPDPVAATLSDDCVAALLSALPARDRRIMVAYHVEGRNIREIGEELRINLTTAWIILERSRKIVLERFAGRPEYLRENFGV